MNQLEAEIERLKAKIKGLEKLNLMTDDEVILDLKAKLKQISSSNVLLQQECLNRGGRIAELERLALRAADALEEAEGALVRLKFSFQSSDLLIAELRKAAKE